MKLLNSLLVTFRLALGITVSRHWLAISLVGYLVAANTIGIAQAEQGAMASPPDLVLQIKASLPATQPGQTATLLPDGHWLLLGGRDAQGHITGQAQRLDKIGAQPVPLTTHLAIPRSGHTATVMPDGSVLIVGGVDATGQTLATLERFYPETQHFETGADLGVTPRSQHSATLLMDGRLLIVGGEDATHQVHNDAELLDIRTGQHENVGAHLNTERAQHLAALLSSDLVLLWGGHSHDQLLQDGELFDRQTLQFLKSDAAPSGITSPVDSKMAPAIRATLPSTAGGDIALGDAIAVRFSKPINPATLNANTVTLIGPQGPVDAKVVPAEAGLLLFVTPKQQLLPASHYTLFIQGALDNTQQALSFSAVPFHTQTLVAANPQKLAPIASTIAPSTTGALATTTQPQPQSQPVGSVDSLLARVSAQIGAYLKGIFDDGHDSTDSNANRESILEAGDGETFVPGMRHRDGRWRTGRALPESVQALLDYDGRTRAAIRGLRTRHHQSTAISLLPEVETMRTSGIAGVVLRLNDQPLANVAVSIEGHSALTDAKGLFFLTGIKPGHYEMTIDGTQAGGNRQEYLEVVQGVDIGDQQMTVLTSPVYLARVAASDWVEVGAPVAQTMVVTHPNLPGLQIEIPKGTVFRDRKGKILTRIAIVPTPLDRAPYAVPDKFPMYFMLHPGGAIIQGLDAKARGIRIIYPNYTHDAPGTVHQFWVYDPARGWIVYGHGHVSHDGAHVEPDDGVDLHEHMGAGHSLPAGTPGPSPAPPPDPCLAGDPVDCYTGLFFHSATDVVLRDVLPLQLTRTYRPGDTSVRPFGKGTTHNYAMYLRNVNGGTSLFELIRPDGSRISFPWISGTVLHVDYLWKHTASPGEFYGATIRAAADGPRGERWALRLRDGRLYEFGAYTGYLTAIFDRSGNQLFFTYGSGAQISRITTANGRYLDFYYDGSGRISSLKDLAGRIWTYSYDTAGNLQQVTYPDTTYEAYTYDTNGRMLTVRDRRGNTMVTNQYDSNGRVIQQTYADNTTNTFAYTVDGSGNTTQTDITNERGVVRHIQFNSAGYIATETFAVGAPEQQIATYARDPATNQVQTKTDALGRVTGYQYDINGNITQITRLQGATNPQVWKYTFDPAYSQMVSATDPANHTRTNVYDTLGNLIQIKDALNNTTDLTYTLSGQLKTFTRYVAGTPLTLTYSYDGGDLTSIVDPLNRTGQFYYDAIGRLLSVKDPQGNIKQTAYDKLNRITKTTDPLGQTVQMGYDGNSNLTSFTDGNNHTTQFAYDGRNRLLSKTDPLNQIESYQYDAIGNLKQITDRKGQVSSFGYDLLNRRTSAGFGATTANPTNYLSTITYTLDAGNRLTTAVDSVSGTIARSFDDLDRLLQELSAQGQINYTYYPNNLRQTMTVQGQSAVNYTYDNANQLTQITQGSATVGFTYDSANRRTTLTLPSGVQITYGYDNVNQLTSLTYQKGAASLGNLTYGYDAAGRRISMGGSLAQVNLPAAITSTSYDAANRPINWGATGQNQTYDANGSLTTSYALSYVWDERGRLNQIKYGSTPVESFQYDAFNRRVGKTQSGTTTSFLNDGWQIVQELNGTTPTANLLTGLGLDQIYRRSTAAAVNDYLTDALGSTIALTDATGAVQTNYSYDPYGNASVSGTASDNPYQYTGREGDITVDYYRNRYYMPGMNRFISEDPIGFKAGQNLAAYVNGDPIRYTDPRGLSADPSDNAVYPSNSNPNNTGGSSWPVNGSLLPWHGDQDGKCSLGKTIGGYMDSMPCVKKCCQEHDNCYDRYNCNFTSWIMITITPCSIICNMTAVGCIEKADKSTGGCCAQ